MAKQTVETEYKATGNHGEFLKGVTSQQAKFAAGAAAAVAAAALVAKGLAEVAKTGKEFEQTMANAKAIMQPTAQQFKSLSSEARRLGESTAFSASQAGEAFVELGKLGFKTNEIIASSGDVLNLASATMADMATAASATAKTINQFNLEAEDAGHVADVIAKASTSSAIDIYNFQEAMKIAGGTASGFNVTLEESTAVVSALADAGLEGTVAGTGFSRMLVEMEKSGSKANTLLKDLGVEGEDLNTKLQAVADAGLSTSEIIDTFGMIAGKSAIAVLNNTEKIQDLTQAYKDSGGAAKEMAETQLDTLDGKLKILKSASEELKLKFFDTFGPGFKFWVEKATEALGFFNDQLAGANDFFDKLISGNADLKASWFDNKLAIETVTSAMADLQIMQDEYGRNGPALFSKERKRWNELKELIKEATGENVEFATATKDMNVAGFTMEMLAVNLDKATEAQQKLAKKRIDDAKAAAVQKEQQKQLNAALVEGGEIKEEDDKAEEERQKKAAEAHRKRLERHNEYAQLVREGLAEKAALDEAARIKEEEDAEKAKERKIELAQLSIDTAGQVTNAVFQVAANRRKREMELDILAVKNSTKSEREKAEEIKKIQEQAAKDEYKIKLGEWGTSLSMSIANTALAVTKLLSNPPAAIAAGVAGAAQTAVIASNKPVKKFARGGILDGPSHAGGGIMTPFGELEGGEAVINKRSAAMFRNELSAINQAGGGASFGGGGGGTTIAPVINITASGGDDALASVREVTPQIRSIVVSALSSAHQNGEIDTSILSVGA